MLKKIWWWIDDRTGISKPVLRMIKHPVPPRSKWAYVFGSATLFCLVLQVVTGIGLSLLYQPSTGEAYKSLEFITNRAKLGNVLRSIHFFGASAMIIMIFVHMARVYITASYKYPREMNWITGVFLLILTIAMGFTGQLLRWDSNGVWSTVVAAQQLGRVPFIGKYLARLLVGGDTINGHSLSRFYSYHVLIIPALIFAFAGFHLYLVLRNGISEPPKAGRLVDPKTYRPWYNNLLREKGVPFWPDAAWRDALFGSLVVMCVITLAIIFGPPPLTAAPDPSVIANSPKPDWFMMPFFALFALMPPRIESYLIVLGPLITIIALLSIPFISNKGERSPIKRPWAMFGVVSIIVFATCLLVIGIKSPWSPEFKAKPLPVTAIRNNNSDSLVRQGVQLFYFRGCEYCHRINNYGGEKGPDLSEVEKRLSAEEIKLQLVSGSKNMPAYGGILSREELNILVYFLSNPK